MDHVRFIPLWVPLEYLVPYVVHWIEYSGPARRAVTNQVGFRSRLREGATCVLRATYCICVCVWPSQSYKLCQFHTKIHSLGSDPRTPSYRLFNHLRSRFILRLLYPSLIKKSKAFTDIITASMR